MTEQARVRLASFSAALVLAALPLLAAVPAHAAPAVSCDEGDDGAFSFELSSERSTDVDDDLVALLQTRVQLDERERDPRLEGR